MDVNNVQEMWSLGTDDYILAIFQMFLDFDLQSFKDSLIIKQPKMLCNLVLALPIYTVL